MAGTVVAYDSDGPRRPNGQSSGGRAQPRAGARDRAGHAQSESRFSPSQPENTSRRASGTHSRSRPPPWSKLALRNKVVDRKGRATPRKLVPVVTQMKARAAAGRPRRAVRRLQHRAAAGRAVGVAADCRGRRGRLGGRQRAGRGGNLSATGAVGARRRPSASFDTELGGAQCAGLRQCCSAAQSASSCAFRVVAPRRLRGYQHVPCSSCPLVSVSHLPPSAANFGASRSLTQGREALQPLCRRGDAIGAPGAGRCCLCALIA